MKGIFAFATTLLILGGCGLQADNQVPKEPPNPVITVNNNHVPSVMGDLVGHIKIGVRLPQMNENGYLRLLNFLKG